MFSQEIILSGKTLITSDQIEMMAIVMETGMELIPMATDLHRGITILHRKEIPPPILIIMATEAAIQTEVVIQVEAVIPEEVVIQEEAVIPVAVAQVEILAADMEDQGK
jgi:uncharacterized protein YueI